MRLYRDQCLETREGVFIKDLRIVKNRSLKDMVIVDNAVYSFGLQLDNGIPILPYYDDKNDEELLHLCYYLKCLAKFRDIREQNRKAFQLRQLEQSDIDEFLRGFGALEEDAPEEEDDQQR